MSADIAELLAAAPLFSRLDSDALSICAREFQEKQFTPGQTLFLRGEPGEHLVLVRAGRVRLAVTTDEGREISVRHAVHGDLIGEIAVLDGGKRSADAVALTPVVAALLRRAQLDRLMERFPAIAIGAIALVCRRLRATTEQLENVALHSIEVRLARYFLTALDGRTAPAGKRVPLDTEVSQSELAQLLGASRPKVNVALGVLEKAGAIKRTSDRIFCDPAGLKKLAGLGDG